MWEERSSLIYIYLFCLSYDGFLGSICLSLAFSTCVAIPQGKNKVNLREEGVKESILRVCVGLIEWYLRYAF